MDIEKLLSDWDTPRTFKELPYRHIMPECTVTIDDRVGEEKGLDKLINNARRKVNNSIKKVRSSIDKSKEVTR
jgi:hypothetical protein